MWTTLNDIIEMMSLNYFIASLKCCYFKANSLFPSQPCINYLPLYTLLICLLKRFDDLHLKYLLLLGI